MSTASRSFSVSLDVDDAFDDSYRMGVLVARISCDDAPCRMHKSTVRTAPLAHSLALQSRDVSF